MGETKIDRKTRPHGTDRTEIADSKTKKQQKQKYSAYSDQIECSWRLRTRVHWRAHARDRLGVRNAARPPTARRTAQRAADHVLVLVVRQLVHVDVLGDLRARELI